ncbi:FecR domain-containing protein [Variovorax sp. Sphag1AA]|uniref:FecR domain-containing protein n=1 Tax=Variovorax sp. Sphag1AA TaxID=2587027 RepID=UPI00160CFD50|nr:FecR domain-containing protein [Variovorax sp. Sphag1AA]MBB3181865.1 transmembrane sensor [Variovorax sp. Sphag1AA]
MSAPPIRAASEVRAIEEAAAWYAHLCSGTATDQDRQRWEAWHAAQSLNAAAWERVGAMQRRLAAVPGALAAPALNAAVHAEAHTRRVVLRSVAVVLGTSALAWWGWRQPARQEWMADLRTGVGELRDLKLADGSRLVLNTRTAVDVAFNASQRLLLLHAGEILVQTAPDPQMVPSGGARPFLVDTAHGRIRALGTRFLVRTDADATRVTVLDKAVEVRSAAGGASDSPILLRAGQQLRFGPGGVGEVVAADPVADAWRQGSIVANDMPLAELLSELGRYRSGVLSCDPSIAGLPVSGAFPVPDTDRALAVLATGLPVRIETRTRYWVRVMPR